ncbi:hypothetical protein [Mesorhizobium sp. M8A.F.Ca.ET.207.01.1.1]|nr:hypothetical protein [Mesorhizobium sp. M8A.F.Ca.ET.207.01.1.1]
MAYLLAFAALLALGYLTGITFEWIAWAFVAAMAGLFVFSLFFPDDRPKK